MAANPNWPALACQVAFNADPNNPATTALWKETAAAGNPVLALSTKRGRQYELDQNQAGTATVAFDNVNENLSPENTSSVYYPNVLPMRQFRAYAAWPLAGNILNATNGYDPLGASFLNWFVFGGSAGAVDGTHVRSASAALKFTWPTAATGVAMAYVRASRLQPGTRYAFSLYVYVPTGSPAVTVKDVGNAATVVSTQTSAVVDAFTRLVFVFDATLETHSLGILTAGASTAGQLVWVDDLQLEYGGSASAFTTTGPVFYSLHTGYVERWPTRWTDAGYRGLVDTTSVDAMAVLANQKLRTEVRTTVLGMSPDYYWPLDEPSGATTFADASGRNGPVLNYEVTQEFGGSFAAGVDAFLAGDPGGTAVMFNETPPPVVFSASGMGLQAGARGSGTPGVDVAADSGAWQLTVALRFRSPTPPATVQLQKIFGLVDVGRFGYPKTALQISANLNFSNTVLWAEVMEQTDNTNFGVGGFDVGAGRNAPVWDNRSHLVVATVDVTAGGSYTVTLYVDALSPSVTTSAVGTAPTMRVTTVEVGANTAGLPGEICGPLLGGAVSHVAVWKRVLSAAERAALVASGPGYVGETSGTRVARYLARGYSGPSVVDTGLSVMGVSTLSAGTSVLEAVQQVAVSENGNAFVNGAGSFRFQDRASRYAAVTSAFTFGDGPGELPYEGDLAFDFDPTQVYNDIEVVRPDGATATAADTASQLTYFIRSLSRTHNVATDLEVTDAANWFLLTHKAPASRVQQVTLTPSTNAALWPAALGCEIGTRVTVKRRPKTGSVVSRDFFVESVEHTVGAGLWVTRFLLSPALNVNVWVLQDPVAGVLDSTTRLAY
jgi:hypothetical protein